MTLPRARGKVFRDLLVSNVVGTPSSVVVKREIILKGGYFDERISRVEDYEAWIRWAEVCEFDYVEEALVNYLVHPGNISSTRSAVHYSWLFDRIQSELESQPRWVKRHALSSQAMLLATMYLQQREWREAQCAYLAALKANPFDFKNYVRLVGSLFPITGEAYLALAATKDSLNARLFKHS